MPYLPDHDRVTDPAVLHHFIAANPLAALVTHDGAAPELDFIPLLLRADASADVLIGHVARGNPLWEPGKQRGPVLAVFGPQQHYISPTWYPSKAEHHEVVPTWNYLTVHARGELVVHDDPKWVRAAVSRLTQHMESGQPDPWRVGMAPKQYLATRLAEIVGIEIRIDSLIGKFKVSAARSEADRFGAKDGIAAASPGATQLIEAMTKPPQLDESD